jgi:hypothetical protein
MEAVLAWLLAECIVGRAQCALARHGTTDTIIICGIAPEALARHMIPTHAWTVPVPRGRWVTRVEVGTRCEEA